MEIKKKEKRISFVSNKKTEALKNGALQVTFINVYWVDG